MSLILESQPTFKWNSLWQPIEYVLYFYDVDFYAVTDNGTGYALVQHDTYTYTGYDDGNHYLYIDGTDYNGMFKILEVVDSTHIVIDTPYIGDDSGIIGLTYAVDTISLVAGYAPPHTFAASNPEETICAIRAVADPIDGKIHIRVEKYLQSKFKISPPFVGYDYWMSTPFHVVDEGLGVLDTIQRYAINSAITTDDLQAFTVPGAILNSTEFIDFQQSIYLYSQIVNDGIYNTKIV